MQTVTLSEEQKNFINKALEGKNILVNACIGSGKTTSIQALCEMIPNKNILYLTYNKLLKNDARSKIDTRNHRNVEVHSYHSYAYKALKMAGAGNSSVGELIERYNKISPPLVKPFEVIIIDEYQDIDTEISEMLENIKEQCGDDVQIIAVGDMCQKIYDRTNLDVIDFINDFVGEREDILFSTCFRLNESWAKDLGEIWNKPIIGVNSNCKVSQMEFDDACKFLANKPVRDIICLGGRTGAMVKCLNKLEKDCPEKFNKNTVYASIRDSDSNMEPTPQAAIFTTYDSSKGMERDTCVLFDFDINYWNMRNEVPTANYEIMRNIFCVAASRGKNNIIIVLPDDKNDEDNDDAWTFKSNKENFVLDKKILKTPIKHKTEFKMPFDVSDMFDYKYIEDIEHCKSLLKIKKIKTEDNTEIDIKTKDGMIDLSPCIGNYQEAAYFKNYDVYDAIMFSNTVHKDKGMIHMAEDDTVQDVMLKITYHETGQARYVTQVQTPFICDTDTDKIKERLSTRFTPNEEVQIKTCMIFDAFKYGEIDIEGRADVLKDNIIYELKFVSELKPEHFLQCATYMVSLGIKKGILWNVRKNEMYEIKVPYPSLFINAVIRTITKDIVSEYRQANGDFDSDTLEDSKDGVNTEEKELRKKYNLPLKGELYYYDLSEDNGTKKKVVSLKNTAINHHLDMLKVSYDRGDGNIEESMVSPDIFKEMQRRDFTVR